MLEFLMAIVLYLGVLLGIASNTSEVNIFDKNIQFTVVVKDGEVSRDIITACGDTYYNFSPIDYRAEFICDGTCYSASNLSGKTMSLTLGSIVHLNGISESGSVVSFWKNNERWYTAITNINIDANSLLGIPMYKIIDNSKMPDIFIAEEENCNVELVYGLYRMLPPYVQNAILSSGYNFIVTNKNLKLMFNREHAIAGITLHDDKTVYLANDDVSIKYSFYHEAGHVLDVIYGHASTTDEFIEIFEEERETFEPVGLFVDGYQKTSSQEYFAVALQNYFLSGTLKEESAPRTYEYIWRFLCKMIENDR